MAKKWVKSRRKHRRVRKSWAGCRCPKGSRRVDTFRMMNGKRVKVGRGWGCLGVGPSQKGKPSPRFVKAECGEEPVPKPRKPKLLPPPREEEQLFRLSAGGRMKSLPPPSR